MKFTNTEMCDMHFCYGLANGNSLSAKRIYEDKYPNQVIPNHTIFVRLHQRLSENGGFNAQHQNKGRPRTVSTTDLEEAVLNEIAEDPNLSSRILAFRHNVSQPTIWRILRRNNLYPYHIQRVKSLLPADYPPRLSFYCWLQENIASNPQFLTEILFTDEANFGRDTSFNFHNNHNWTEESSHSISEVHNQQRFSVNVWAGIIADHLIGTYFLPTRLNGDGYRRFLQHQLPAMLEDASLQIRSRMYFMHDGAPAHFSSTARDYLDDAYPNRWIGRGGPQSWPPRSPDLNPLDYFFWGHLKSLVYTTPIESIEDLRNRISASCEIIGNTPGIFERTRQSMRRRIEACITVDGGHFQHLL